MSLFTTSYQETVSHVIAPDTFFLRSLVVTGLDRQLGYFGSARLVTFAYDSRTESVVWNDGKSYGYGSGAWRPFVEHIEPLAQELNLVIDGQNGSYVLLVDRLARKAYFTRRDRAEIFIRNQDRNVTVSAA